MEEKLKQLEERVEKIDRVLGIILGWAIVNKKFMDALSLEEPKKEEGK